MFEVDLLNEADRQFSICNACRYCEGFCAVFPAVERRTRIGDGDLGYLANLCHDCRMCYDACMFVPPHEFAINVPRLLAEARTQTYRAYGVPQTLARLLQAPGRGTVIVVASSLALILAVIALQRGGGSLTAAYAGPGAFYRVLPYLLIVIPIALLVLLSAAALVAGGLRFARDTGASKQLTWRSVRCAIRDALSLVYMTGGDAGCYDVRRGSAKRRIYHSLVFWGFVADAASTTAAAVYQDILHRLPPYSLESMPVVLGMLGGVAIVAGCIGLLAIKRRSDARPKAERMVSIDYAFLGLLLATASTGLLLLALRSTASMPLLLAVHLSVVLGLFVTAPYSKFVHFVYRLLALAQHAAE